MLLIIQGNVAFIGTKISKGMMGSEHVEYMQFLWRMGYEVRHIRVILMPCVKQPKP